ncbi:MAG: hypothetical protein OHK0037_23760 [Elainellaceae cyanobacterium]
MLPRYFPKIIDDWAIASADSNSGWELEEKEFMGASPGLNKHRNGLWERVLVYF